jgi:hypothetical protein
MIDATEAPSAEVTSSGPPDEMAALDAGWDDVTR